MHIIEVKNIFFYKNKTKKQKVIFTYFKYAIHNAEIIVEGNKIKENKWDLNVEILDRFDFTDFIFPEEYNNKY